MKHPTSLHLRPPALAGLVAVAAAVLGCAACARRTGEAPRSAATVAGEVTLTSAQQKHIHLFTVASSAFRRTIEANATVDFDGDRATGVLAPFSGPVTRLLVSAGDVVAKGAPLAIVDSPDFATAVSAYRKAITTARTARHLADLEKDLLQHHGVSAREEAQALTDAANAEADKDAARRALVSLNVDPRTIEDIARGKPIARIEGVIRAPIAGTVVERQISRGELLQAGSTPCFTIADLSHVWVLAQLFGADADAVRVGDPADISTGGEGERFAGVLSHLSAEVDPSTRAVLGRITAANPGDRLRRRMYVRVWIHSRRESRGLLIPVSAILRDDENLPFVYVAAADGRFARRRVTLGYRAGPSYDIADGLRAGDRVVVEGGLFLQFIENQ